MASRGVIKEVLDQGHLTSEQAFMQIAAFLEDAGKNEIVKINDDILAHLQNMKLSLEAKEKKKNGNAIEDY